MAEARPVPVGPDGLRDPAQPDALRDPVRVVRVIARLNIGGPAIQAINLTRRLEERGFATTLVRGQEEPDEGSMDDLAAALGVTPHTLVRMRRNPGVQDVPALLELAQVMRRARPEIVHTHAAKAGTLGRLAALAARTSSGRRPVIVHTYHGHSLRGYFSPRTTEVYRRIEQGLARVSDRLIAVSSEIRDELVDLDVAPAAKFDVVPLGFDLAPFAPDPRTREPARRQLRQELGIPLGAHVVTLVARLVPIKRVDRFLAAAAAVSGLTGAAAETGEPAAGPAPHLHFLIVGDGELRDQLQSSPEARALAGRLTWAGFRRDMPDVLHASDLVVQCSDNEGTPVSLIEAQAAGVAVVSTDVGGTPSVVDHGRTGLLVPREDGGALASAIAVLSGDPAQAAAYGAAGRERALERFGLERLITEVTGVYHDALERRR